MPSMLFSCAFLLPMLLLFHSSESASNIALYQRVIKLVNERLDLAKWVALYKWQNNQSIEAPAQEASVLANVAELANASGLDQTFARQFFQDQINASKSIQYSHFAIWTLIGAPAVTAPDLNTVLRPQIGNITSELVLALVPVQLIRLGPFCPFEVSTAKLLLALSGQIHPNPEEANNRPCAQTAALAHLCLRSFFGRF